MRKIMNNENEIFTFDFEIDDNDTVEIISLTSKITFPFYFYLVPYIVIPIGFFSELLEGNFSKITFDWFLFWFYVLTILSLIIFIIIKIMTFFGKKTMLRQLPGKYRFICEGDSIIEKGPKFITIKSFNEIFLINEYDNFLFIFLKGGFFYLPKKKIDNRMFENFSKYCNCFSCCLC